MEQEGIYTLRVRGIGGLIYEARFGPRKTFDVDFITSGPVNGVTGVTVEYTEPEQRPHDGDVLMLLDGREVWVPPGVPVDELERAYRRAVAEKPEGD